MPDRGNVMDRTMYFILETAERWEALGHKSKIWKDGREDFLVEGRLIELTRTVEGEGFRLEVIL